MEESKICSEASIRNNMENKLLFILMCMVSTTQGTFQYKKSDSGKSNIVPHKLDESLIVVRKYLNFVYKRVRLNLDAAIIEIIGENITHDIKRILDNLNVLNIQDYYQ